MRDYKFRAWHKHGNNFENPGMIFDNNHGDCLRWLSDGQEIIDIMQYTGLKDKKGKEIYENDIIKRTMMCPAPDDEDFIGVVKFMYGAFYLERLDGKDGRLLWDDVAELEIIGNVFDNKELLEAK